MKMWVEKYRPKNLDELIGQPKAVSILRNLGARLKNGDIVHALFYGPSGCGKTSAAVALAREIFGPRWKYHYLELNASDERGINTVREKVKYFSRISGLRILFLDEADQMTSDAQHALRRIMELTSSAMFILSCNDEWKIIDAVKSRCVNVPFRRLSDKEVGLVLRRILEAEGVPLKPEYVRGLVRLVKEAKGDLRWAINNLEALVTEKGTLALEAVMEYLPVKFAPEALRLAVSGEFVKAREMLEEAYINAGFNSYAVINELYRAIPGLDGVDDDVKVKLYAKLAEAERGIRLGGDPLIQLAGFLADAWVLPHLPKYCPARRG